MQTFSPPPICMFGYAPLYFTSQVHKQHNVHTALVHTKVRLDGSTAVTKVPLPQEAVRTFLRVLQQGVSALSPELLPELQRVQQQSIKMYPALTQVHGKGGGRRS